MQRLFSVLVSPPLWHIWADRLDLGSFVAAAPSEVAAIFILVTSTPQCSLSCSRCMSCCCFFSAAQYIQTRSRRADPPSALIGFVAVRFVSAGGPRRIKFPWRFIKEESLAECDCDPAGCSVRCRVQTRNQPDVSRDLGGGDRVNKSFCMWLLHIHSSGRAFRFICILPTGGSYYSEEIWQHFFMEQQQLISWSLQIDYFLTAACGPFWNKVELHAEWNSISVSGPS